MSSGNFLGIGGGEFILILIIAVLIVGPEKMVEMATKLGLMVARIRNMTKDATREFREALAVDEVEEAFKEVANEVKDIDREIKGTASDVAQIGTEAQAASQEFQTLAQGKQAPLTPEIPPTPAPASKSGGAIPKAVLDILGPPPAKDAEGHLLDGDPGIPADVAYDAGEDAAPIELQQAILVEKEEDLEPTVIEDTMVYQDESKAQQKDTGEPSE